MFDSVREFLGFDSDEPSPLRSVDDFFERMKSNASSPTIAASNASIESNIDSPPVASASRLQPSATPSAESGSRSLPSEEDDTDCRIAVTNKLNKPAAKEYPQFSMDDWIQHFDALQFEPCA